MPHNMRYIRDPPMKVLVKEDRWMFLLLIIARLSNFHIPPFIPWVYNLTPINTGQSVRISPHKSSFDGQ